MRVDRKSLDRKSLGLRAVEASLLTLTLNPKPFTEPEAPIPPPSRPGWCGRPAAMPRSAASVGVRAPPRGLSGRRQRRWGIVVEIASRARMHNIGYTCVAVGRCIIEAHVHEQGMHSYRLNSERCRSNSTWHGDQANKTSLQPHQK